MPVSELNAVSQSVPFRSWLRLLLVGYWLFFMAILASRASVWFDLASHFVWQGILGGGLLCLLCAARRRWKMLAWALVPWCYLVVLFQPWSLWFGAPEAVLRSSNDPAAATQQLKVMSWNVLCVNENLDEMLSIIQQHPVDVLVLIEVRPNLFEQIPQLEQMYKHRLDYPSWAGNGIAVLTDRSDVQLSRIDFGGDHMPSIVASVDGSIQVVGVHTWSPFPRPRTVARNRQLADLSKWVGQQSGPVCVVGDLNITPWAPAFQELLKAGMFDSRVSGFGNSASWPAWMGPLGIPIDHALSHGSCTITRRALGPMVSGSDHRPVLIEIAY